MTGKLWFLASGSTLAIAFPAPLKRAGGVWMPHPSISLQYPVTEAGPLSLLRDSQTSAEELIRLFRLPENQLYEFFAGLQQFFSGRGHFFKIFFGRPNAQNH
jgi:hypothetical protein